MSNWKLADINFDKPFEAPKETAEIPANRAIQKFIVHGPSGQTFMWDRTDASSGDAFYHAEQMRHHGLPVNDLYNAPDTYAGYVEMHGDPYRANAGNEPYVWDAYDHEIPPEVGQHLTDLAKRRLADPTLKTSAYQDEQGDWQYDDEIEPPPAGEWAPARERYPQWTRQQPSRPVQGPPPGTFNWLDRQKPGEIHGLGGDCISPKCQHSWSDEEQHELANYGEITCPSCDKLQNNIGQLGGAPSKEEYQKAQIHNNPVRAGITLKAMGDIGEAVIQRIGQLPCGPVVQDMNAVQDKAPVDFIAGYPGKEYGVEVKANHSAAQPRFKLSGSPAKRQRKIEFCHAHGLRQGFCGVRLNFYTDKADVFWREGFTDTWYGDTQMQHVGTYDFGDLNPFRQEDGSHHVPAAESMPDQAVDGDMLKVAMPYHNNTWYHVTPQSYLPSIAEHGLVPQTMGSSAPNWPGIERDNRAVYLHQNLDSAQNMARQALRSKGPDADYWNGNVYNPGIPNWPMIDGKPDKPAILRVRNIDRNQVVPDPEDFGNTIEGWMQDDDMGHSDPIHKEIIEDYRPRPEHGEDEWGSPSVNESINAVDHLHRNHPEYMRGLTRGLADDEGKRMMTLGGPVHPNNIEHVHLPTTEEWHEGFDAEHPGLDPESEEYYDRQNEYEERNPLPPEWGGVASDYEDEGPESGADDAYAQYAHYTPLRDYVQQRYPAWQPPPPERPGFTENVMNRYRNSSQEPTGAPLSLSQPLQVLSPAEYRLSAREPWRERYDYRTVNLPQANHHCGSCGAFKKTEDGKGRCAMFDAEVENDHTCSEWLTHNEWEQEEDAKKANDTIGHESSVTCCPQCGSRNIEGN